jgi:hypothetical protein
VAYRKTREFRVQEELLFESAQDAARLSHMRYTGGVTGYLEVLTNETNTFAAELALVRQPIREDLAQLQSTLLQTKQLLVEMQVLVRANDYKIDDTIENLRMATENLGQLTESVKQQPWSLIRIKQPEDRKTRLSRLFKVRTWCDS